MREYDSEYIAVTILSLINQLLYLNLDWKFLFFARLIFAP